MHSHFPDLFSFHLHKSKDVDCLLFLFFSFLSSCLFLNKLLFPLSPNDWFATLEQHCASCSSLLKSECKRRDMSGQQLEVFSHLTDGGLNEILQRVLWYSDNMPIIVTLPST